MNSDEEDGDPGEGEDDPDLFRERRNLGFSQMHETHAPSGSVSKGKANPKWVASGGGGGGGGRGGGGADSDSDASSGSGDPPSPKPVVRKRRRSVTRHKPLEDVEEAPPPSTQEGGGAPRSVSMQEMRESFTQCGSEVTCPLCLKGFMIDAGSADTNSEKKLRKMTEEIFLNKSFPLEYVIIFVSRWHNCRIPGDPPWSEEEVALHLQKHTCISDVVLENDFQKVAALEEEVSGCIVLKRGGVSLCQHQTGKFWLELMREKRKLMALDRNQFVRGGRR